MGTDDTRARSESAGSGASPRSRAAARLLHVGLPTAEERRAAANALVVLYGVVVLGALATLPLLLAAGRVAAGTCAAVTATAALSTLLVRSGRATVALGLFVAVVLVGNLAAFVLGRDARLTAVYLVIPVAVAAVTLRAAWVVVVTVVALAMGAAGTLLEPPVSPPLSAGEVITASVVLACTVLVTTQLGVWGQRREARRADEEARRATRLAGHLRAVNADLERRVEERTLELQRALARQEDLVAELAELSLRDPLTGLHNRRHVDQQLPRLLAATGRHGRPLAVAIADLDRFKRVNDGHSYRVGDEVLRRFAQILGDNARASDLVARYGGEEFLLVMPETTLEQAGVIGERLRAEVENHPWDAVAPGLDVTVSIGVASTEHHPLLVPLVAAADAALHGAKREGRNRVVAAGPGASEAESLLPT